MTEKDRDIVERALTACIRAAGQVVRRVASKGSGAEVREATRIAGGIQALAGEGLAWLDRVAEVPGPSPWGAVEAASLFTAARSGWTAPPSGPSPTFEEVMAMAEKMAARDRRAIADAEAAVLGPPPAAVVRERLDGSAVARAGADLPLMQATGRVSLAAPAYAPRTEAAEEPYAGEEPAPAPGAKRRTRRAAGALE